MSDRNNDALSEESLEKLTRAEKINRIKNSIRAASQNAAPEAKHLEAAEINEKITADIPEVKPVQEVKPEPVVEAADQAENDWESALFERISKKEEQPQKENITTAESILAELDMLRMGIAPKKAPEKPVVREVVSHAAEPVPEKPVAREVVSHAAEPAPEKPVVREAVSHAVESAPEKPVVREVVSHAVESVPEKPAAREAVSHAVESEPEKTAENKAKAEEKLPDEAPVKKSNGRKKKKKKKKKPFKERLRDLFPRKEDKITEKIRKVVFLVSIVVIVVCGYLVSDYYLDLWKSRKLNSEVMNMYSGYETEVPTANNDNIVDYVDDRPVYVMLDGARKLLDLNSDIVGVINIPDTPVNNPVLKASNNEKYLDRKLNGDKSRAGELFMDHRNKFYEIDNEGHMIVPNSENIVIYGHNMGDESMFGSLKSYRNYDYYYEKHPIIYLNSNYGHAIYKIFAFFILDADDKSETAYDCWNKLDFDDEDDFYDFVNEAKRRTLRTNDVDVKYGDGLLTLSTCNTLLGDRGRLIVMARLLRDGEDLKEGTQNSAENPNIKWPSLYYTYKGKSNNYDPDADFVPYGPTVTTAPSASGTTAAASGTGGKGTVTTTTTTTTKKQ